MRLLLHRLVDGKTDYPSVHLSLDGQGLLFDCGEGTLLPREVHGLAGIFISHLHIDHFLGFDRIICHGIDSDVTYRVFGPAGTARGVLAKLQAYTWNLLQREALRFEVTDLEATARNTYSISVPYRMELRPMPYQGGGLDEPALRTPGYTVRAAVLDHGTPCLAFAFEESPSFNIDTEAAAARGLEPGPWMRRLKELADQPDAVLEVGAVRVPVADVADLLLRRPGRSVAYACDFAFHRGNLDRLVGLARGADVLYCEANFLNEDDKAFASSHLTAGQAGQVAAAAEVGELVLFHHSRKYRGQDALFVREASRYFSGPIR